MTQSKKRALASLFIGSGVLAGFAVVFFCRGGPEALVGDKGRILVSAVLFAAGFAGQLVVFYLTRVRPGDRAMQRDERDDWIARRANGAALVAALVYVFLVCIVLWEVYHDRQHVPVGWMWFLAYTSGFFAMFSHAVASLVLDAGVSGRAEG